MARESREERQRKRALEELAAAIARQDAERAVTALLQLPPPERTAELPPVALLFRTAVAHDHHRGNWPRLGFWAARAEREPRLLLAGADDSTANGAVWTLMWARARSKQWESARRHAAALAGRLPARLQSALDAYLIADGAPAPEIYREFFDAPMPPSDPRFGYDKGQQSTLTAAVPRAPRGPAEVESAVLACAAHCSPGQFVEAAMSWADASPELAAAILTLAARLQRGEILSRMSRGASALEPAQALADFVRRLRYPPELESEMELALRAAGALLRDRSEGLERSETRGFAAIVRVAAAFPGLRPGALALALNARFEKGAKAVALELLEDLCRLPGAAAPLQLQALVMWASQSSPDDTPPRWISTGFSELLKRSGELAGGLAQTPERIREAVLVIAPLVLPREDAERFWEQAWAWADDASKLVLLDGFDELLLRARGRGESQPAASFMGQAMIKMAYEMGFDPETDDLEELKRILSTPKGLRAVRELEGVIATGGGPLPPAARRIWDRFANQVIPFRVSYLEIALEQGGRTSERMQAVERFLGDKGRDVRAVIEAILSAERGDCRLASKALLDHLLVWLKDDWEGLAQALLEAGRFRLRRGIRTPLARAFEEVDARARADGRLYSATVLSARFELRLLRGRARPKSGLATPRKRRRKSRVEAEQTHFQFDEK